MDGKVIVLLRTSSVARALVYRHLRTLGAILVVVHPYAPAHEFDGIFHHVVLCETDDVVKLRVALCDFLTRKHLEADAVVSFDEYAVYQAAALAVELHLTPTPLPPTTIQQNNLKDQFRLFCAVHRISSPKSVRLPLSCLPTPPEMHAFAQRDGELDAVFEKLLAGISAAIRRVLCDANIEFPVVLKPSPGAGSLLARLCATLEEVTSHVWRMWQTLANHPDTRHFTALANGIANAAASPTVQILAEEYIEGQEVDMDCVIEHGCVRFCAISDNFAPEPPYFAEVGGLCPSALAYDGQRALRDLLEAYVTAHGDKLHGVLHFEAKYDAHRKKAYVIEVNCRPGSAETNTMVQTVYREMSLGESLVRCALQLPIHEQLTRLFPEVLVRRPISVVPSAATPPAERWEQAEARTELPMWLALGGPTRGFFPPQCWTASVNLYPTEAGILRKVRVPVGDTSLVTFSVSAEPGESVAPPPARFYLLSWMVARGKTAAEAIEHIQRVTEAFVQEVEPVSRI